MANQNPSHTIGYLRVSTDTQDLDKNRADILTLANKENLGRVRFVEEKVSGNIPWRKRKIAAVLDELSEGDVLILSELSRLGRSMLECIEIMKLGLIREKIMHDFMDIAERSISFTLQTIEEKEAELFNTFENSCSTILIKNLQAMAVQKAVVAVGLFSIFEASLQDNNEDGFQKVRRILNEQEQLELLHEFNCYCDAINVLKHGSGRSYKRFMENFDALPFRIKKSPDDFFCEGNVDEIDTLVLVDKAFIQQCLDIIARIKVELSYTPTTELT